MKDIILVISLLVAVGLSVVVVRFAEKADKAGKSLEEERYSRMVAEETLQKNDAKLTNFQEQVKEDQDKMGKIEDILNQEKGVNSDLKKQYDELTEAKTDLEAKLQTVLQEKAAAVLQAQTTTTAASATPAAPTTVQPAGQSTPMGH
jgi:predicted nuclease with TOPRIM domain